MARRKRDPTPTAPCDEVWFRIGRELGAKIGEVMTCLSDPPTEAPRASVIFPIRPNVGDDSPVA